MTLTISEACPKKEVCGSCTWSEFSYADQLEKKVQQINSTIKKAGLDFGCSQIIPSPKISHYRNRMDFVINYQGYVGLRQKGKWWKVIDNHTCFIADTKIEEAFGIVRTWVHTSGLTFYDRKLNNGFLRYAVIRTTSKDSVMVNIVTSAPQRERQFYIEQFQELAALLPNASTLLWSINTTSSDVSFGEELICISGDGFLVEEILGNRYIISPNSFFQTNSSCAEKLLELVTNFAADVSNKNILDLYCGSGFFTLSLAKKAKKTVGVESSKDSIRDANANLRLNNSPASFIHSKAEDAFELDFSPDLIVVDPPRGGLHPQAIKLLEDYASGEIIYISCNYESFLRDFNVLKNFYFVQNCIAVDMFPHTPHVEVVFHLRKHK